MGDYNKLIVSCIVSKTSREEIEQAIESILPIGFSFYQSDEEIISIEAYEPDAFDRRPGMFKLIIVCQTKYGRGIKEFCEWLHPHVLQGSGSANVYAMEFSEYSAKPFLYHLELLEDL